MKKHTLINLTVLILLPSLFFGCKGQGYFPFEVKPSSRDISGVYKVFEKESGFPFAEFEITKEADESDIIVNLKRLWKFTSEEEAIIKKYQVNSTQASEVFGKPIILGEGAPLDKEGEHITQDQGRTSEFYVCSQKLYRTGSAKNQKIQAYFCLKGVLSKNSSEIKGSLAFFVDDIVFGAKANQVLSFEASSLKFKGSKIEQSPKIPMG